MTFKETWSSRLMNNSFSFENVIFNGRGRESF
jgi:hypothetical protein